MEIRNWNSPHHFLNTQVLHCTFEVYFEYKIEMKKTRETIKQLNVYTYRGFLPFVLQLIVLFNKAVFSVSRLIESYSEMSEQNIIWERLNYWLFHKDDKNSIKMKLTIFQNIFTVQCKYTQNSN